MSYLFFLSKLQKQDTRTREQVFSTVFSCLKNDNDLKYSLYKSDYKNYLVEDPDNLLGTLIVIIKELNPIHHVQFMGLRSEYIRVHQ